MAHYHEVYFNPETIDGPRIGCTRRSKKEIQAIAQETPRWQELMTPAIVRCNRADDQCPWTKEGPLDKAYQNKIKIAHAQSLRSRF